MLISLLFSIWNNYEIDSRFFNEVCYNGFINDRRDDGWTMDK